MKRENLLTRRKKKQFSAFSKNTLQRALSGSSAGMCLAKTPNPHMSCPWRNAAPEVRSARPSLRTSGSTTALSSSRKKRQVRRSWLLIFLGLCDALSVRDKHCEEAEDRKHSLTQNAMRRILQNSYQARSVGWSASFLSTSSRTKAAASVWGRTASAKPSLRRCSSATATSPASPR